MKCTHYACRCIRAEELAQIHDRTGNPTYMQYAIAAHYQEAECRLKRPPPQAPSTNYSPGGSP
jgi:hypothetical protein